MQAFSALWIPAQWSLAEIFIAGSTLSPSPTASTGFNLARHVADDPVRVAANRSRLQAHFPAEAHFLWLNQTHSATVVEAAPPSESPPQGDATVSRDPNVIPVVMTADCLPILLATSDGSQWAAIHAGWQGLYRNIIAATVAKFPAASTLAAWIGPCIRQANYEIDAPFRERFCAQNPAFAAAFAPARAGHYYADLPAIARYQLQQAGVMDIADCQICTFADARFFSHRRDGQAAGRFATFITPRQK